MLSTATRCVPDKKYLTEFGVGSQMRLLPDVVSEDSLVCSES